jgi:hypothetical protein
VAPRQVAEASWSHAFVDRNVPTKHTDAKGVNETAVDGTASLDVGQTVLTAPGRR